MEKTFVCSLVHNGLLGGGLYLDEQSVTYRTNKLTVDKKYRNLVLPLSNIKDITWSNMVFPVATFHMSDGEDVKILIFNKNGFMDHYHKVINQANQK